MKRILAIIATVITLTISAEADESVWQMRQSVALVARQTYAPIGDMSDVQVAYYDARKKTPRRTIGLFRRYYDDTERTQLTNLDADNAPTHIFVIANSMSEAQTAAEKLTALSLKHPQTVLLLAGNATTSDTLPSTYDAAFYLPSATKEATDALVQAAFGGSPVTISNAVPFACANLVPRAQSKTRLGYADPEDVDMDSEKMKEIDDIMTKMIKDEASPGGYVLVARRGEVVWSKPYGTTTYTSGKKITSYSLYDIASLSKAIGTLPIVMRLFEENALSASMTLGTFFTDLEWEKMSISIEQLLLHTSGLPASVPAFLISADSTTLEKPYYSGTKKKGFSVQIEPGLYIRDGIKLRPGNFSTTDKEPFEHIVARNLFCTDTIPQLIKEYIDQVKLLDPTYRYSDLNFIYLQRIAEQIYGMDLDMIYSQEITRPLGIRRLLYCPVRFYSEGEIVDTENDRYFRKQQLRGTVHDQTAALLGGVAGNAGLFGTANEIAKVAQLYLNRGEYGGVRLCSGLTVDEFTKRHSDDCRRGYGFDKPEFRKGKSSPVVAKASLASYGHSGFSGTLFWVDPDEELIYIFLSNRICPNAYNNKLTKEGVRSEVHQVIYNSIRK